LGDFKIKKRWEYFRNGNNNPEETFRGEIIKIENGKDGSTVTLKNYQNEIIKSTVSIPNLGINSNFDFSSIKIGNIIEVHGETFKMQDMTHLTAKYATIVFNEKTKVECQNNNGTYEASGMLAIYMCNMPTNDSMSVCTSSTECEGLCLSKDGEGVCSPSTINFGCIPVIENGGQEVTICID